MGGFWWLYVLRCGDGSLYTGITPDLERRLAQHRAGRGAKYTRGRGPLELVHRECHASRSEALRRERAVKGMSRVDKLRLVASSEGPPPPPSSPGDDPG